MAHPDLTSPLLTSSQPSDQPHTILTIHEHNHKPQQNHTQNQHQTLNGQLGSSSNAFDFMGLSPISVPPPSTVDPFKNGTEKIDGVYEMIKIVICLPIALIRLVLFGLCLAVGYVATRIALEGWKDKHNPMPKWRSRLMWITRICARCILFSFGYQWIRRKGKPAPREIAPIVVSNHVSYVEPIFYFYELFPTMVASESHDAMPFVGTIVRAMQVIYVNRFSPSSRKNAVNEIKRKASCDQFPCVLLFPEGTTTNGRVLITFQLGAFIPAYPIQPVIVHYPHVHFDQSWGLISLGKLMFRMFTQFHNFMEVEYLPVVFPLENQKETPPRFAKRTRQIIAKALNVAQTSHSYGDVMLLMKAEESNQEKPSSYLVEMAQVESLFHLSSLEAVEFLVRYLSMNPDPSGSITFGGFLRGMRLKACNLSEEIFRFVDLENTGMITFKQFLFASAHILKHPVFRRACELAFLECDIGGNGYITEEQFGGAFGSAMPEMSKEEIHELFRLFDTDDDGRVSKEEFLSRLRREPLLIALFSQFLRQNGLSEDGQTTPEEEVV